MTTLAIASAASAAPAADRVIVGFKPGVDARERSAVRRAAGVAPTEAMLLDRTQVVRPRDASPAEAVRELERNPNVAFAEREATWHAFAPAPNDPRFGDQWGMLNAGQTISGAGPGTPGVDTNALAAWDRTRGEGVVIAIVDTGVAADHPDVAPRLWTNPGEVPANGVDDDGNGFVDDVRGWDFRDDDADPDDFHRHGTHVAATAAGATGNGIGTAGVAPGARIMAVRGLNDNGSGSTIDIANGIAYAARNGASVINLSLGGTAASAAVSSAIFEAALRGAVVVVAAGNDGADNDVAPSYPCNFTHANLVCVTAITNTGALASFANRGARSVDLGAPGASVLAPVPAFAPAPAFPGGASTEGFDAAATLPSGWQAGAEPGNAWAVAANPTAPSAPNALADSPGGPYANNRDTTVTSAPLNLSGRAGCRAQYRLQIDNDPLTRLSVGLLGAGPADVRTGSSAGGWQSRDIGIAAADGLTNRRLLFRQTTGATGSGDGVNVDDVTVRCRTGAVHAESTGYRFLSGTSMATPYVAGAAALVQAANPGASADDVAAALVASAAPLPALSGVTVSGGRLDAAAALGSLPPPPPPPPPTTPPAPGPEPPPPPQPEAEPPRILRASIAPRKFAVGARSTPRTGRTSRVPATRSAQPRKGATVRFTLDGAATVTLEVRRRVAVRCRTATGRPRDTRRRCHTYRQVARLDRQARAGANRVAFSGRIGRKELVRSTYQLRLVATRNALRSAPRTLTFEIVRPARARR